MQIAPYLFFHGQCEEALHFYAKVLGGKITGLMRYEGSPMDTPQLPPNWREKVLHASLHAEGADIMASDGFPGAPAPIYGGFSVSLYIPNDRKRAEQVFEALSERGKVTMEFQQPFWGGHFGMLVDQFGVSWMVSTE